MNVIAEQYVRLVLAVGQYDADYVDAYYGPPAWRSDIQADTPSLSDIITQATNEIDTLSHIAVSPGDTLLVLRKAYLSTQLSSLWQCIR